MGIGDIWTVSKRPQPHLLSSHCIEVIISLEMVVPGPASKAMNAIHAYLVLRAPTILDHSYGALL